MADKAPVSAPPSLDDMSFDDWLIDVEIWEDFNKDRLKTKVGNYLYQHLKGKAKETVRNDLSGAEIKSGDGYKLIIESLTKLYKKDTARHEYVTFDKFIKFKRPADMSIKDYLVEYNIRYNKVKSYAGKLPEAVLGYSLLENANLTEEKKEICRATCSKLTYDEMITQIEKVCVGLSPEKLAPKSEKLSFSHNDSASSSKQLDIKDEPSDDLIAYSEHLNDPNQAVFYSNRNNSNAKKTFQKKFRK